MIMPDESMCSDNGNNYDDKGDSSDNNKNEKMFSLKKWNAVAMWSWDVECDTCAICRVQVMGKLRVFKFVHHSINARKTKTKFYNISQFELLINFKLLQLLALKRFLLNFLSFKVFTGWGNWGFALQSDFSNCFTSDLL